MRKSTFLIVALSVFLAACEAPPKRERSILGDPIRSGARGAEVDTDLIGTWAIKSATMAGKPLAMPPTFELKINGDRYASGPAGNYVDRGRLVLFSDELAGQARRLDVIGEDGPNKGKRIPALYRFEGRELHIVYDLSAENRPTVFSSTAENKHFYVVYIKRM
jgi:uncharacterized protein (TIGR03067 family)